MPNDTQAMHTSPEKYREIEKCGASVQSGTVGAFSLDIPARYLSASDFGLKRPPEANTFWFDKLEISEDYPSYKSNDR